MITNLELKVYRLERQLQLKTSGRYSYDSNKENQSIYSNTSVDESAKEYQGFTPRL